MGSKTRLSCYCTKRANNGVNLVTSRKINTRLARPIAITLNIILYEFSGVYGHTINLLPSEYVNSETMSPIIIFVMKQDKYIIVGLKCPSYS